MSGIEMRALGDLHESEDNPRQISDERYEALKYALQADSDMLLARPIIATPDGEVVCGNMRLRALLDLGWTEAPVFTADLDPAQKREWMLRDNQEYGDWVPEELAAMVKLHAEEDADMKLLGFSEGRLENLVALADGEESDAKTASQNGDGDEPEVWGVIVECASEGQQAQLLDRLTDEGFSVRAILPT